MISLIDYLLGISTVESSLLKKSGICSKKAKYTTNYSKRSEVYAKKPKLNRKILKCNKK